MNLLGALFIRSCAATLILCGLSIRTNGQVKQPQHRGEQTSFSVEFDFDRPVPVNEAAKKALATAAGLADDLKQKHLEPKDLPDRWFTASRIHLGDGGQVGLVVMGSDGLMANNSPFWILRQTTAGYDLVLDTIAADLEVLKTKTNGLRDIEVAAPIGIAYWGSNEFQFDGHRYRLTKRISQTTGVKIPTDLTGYETHAPFVQHAADDSSTLAEARTWIWQHWKDHKLFCMTVVTQNDDGNQATYQLYTSADSDYPGLVVKVHTSHWEQDSPSEQRRKITEDDLWIASNVERVYPATDDQHDPQIIPEQKDVAASAYRLNFREGAFSLATL